MVIHQDFDERSVVLPVPQGSGVCDSVAVLDWRAWDRFLLTHVLGAAAVRFEVDPFREFPADLFEHICKSFSTVCFQINLSLRRDLPVRVGELTRRFAERGVYVVNGNVQDTRKSTLHAHLDATGLPSLKAARGGPPDEILFVKTDLNYGGNPERWLAPENVESAGFQKLISPEICAYDYRTAARQDLEDAVWKDPAIIVEKFVTNAQDSFYRVYFSGIQIIIVQAFAPGIVKKLSRDPRDTNFVTELEFLKAGTDQLHIARAFKQDVATFVENTPVEFGCVDIVHDGHDAYIVDLNLTPSTGYGSVDSDLANYLRPGITNAKHRKPGDFPDSPLART